MAYKRPERVGHYDRRLRCYIYKIVNPKFHRKTQVLDGVSGTLLPYVMEKPFLRPGETSPRGNPAYLECYRQTWWANGRVCFVHNDCDEPPSETCPRGRFTRRFRPVTGSVFNRYDHEPTYSLVDGVLVESLAAGRDENGCLY